MKSHEGEGAEPDPGAGQGPPPGGPWRLRAAAFLSSFDRFTIPPLLVPIHLDLGVPLGAAAVVASAYFVAYGLSQPVWGALSDRVGRVAVIRTAVAGGGLACVVAAAAQDLVLLVAARTLAGFFFAALMPAAITYVGDTVPLRLRPHGLTVLMAFTTAGITCATIVAGVMAEWVSWRAAFLVSAGLAAVLTVVLPALPEPEQDRPTGSLRARVWALRGRPWLAVVLGLAFLEGAVIFGSLTFVAASLQDVGVGAALAGSAAAGFGIGNVASAPLATRAVSRAGAPALIAGGGTLVAAGLLLVAADATVLTGVLGTLGLGAGFGFLHPTMQTWATEVHAQERALTVSLFAGSIFVGGAIASAVAAPLADHGHFGLIFVLGAAGAVLLATAGPALRSRYGEA